MSRAAKIDTLCEQVMLASALGGVCIGMGGVILQSVFWLGCTLMASGFGLLCLATLIQGRVRREALALEEEALQWSGKWYLLRGACVRFLRAEIKNHEALMAALKEDE